MVAQRIPEHVVQAILGTHRAWGNGEVTSGVRPERAPVRSAQQEDGLTFSPATPLS